MYIYYTYVHGSVQICNELFIIVYVVENKN